MLQPRAEPGLTARETEVMHLVVQGLPNKLIAARTGIAVSTVKAHISAIMLKWHCHNRTQVALKGTP